MGVSPESMRRSPLVCSPHIRYLQGEPWAERRSLSRVPYSAAGTGGSRGARCGLPSGKGIQIDIGPAPELERACFLVLCFQKIVPPFYLNFDIFILRLRMQLPGKNETGENFRKLWTRFRLSKTLKTNSTGRKRVTRGTQEGFLSFQIRSFQNFPRVLKTCPTC